MPSTIQALSSLAELAKARRDRAPGGVPPPKAILRRALAEHGWTTEDLSGSLDIASRVKLLHTLRLVARAWLRREADALESWLYPDYDDDEAIAKSLIGDAAEKVSGFFGRASKLLRNAVVAGWLAVAGPGEPREAEAEAIRRGLQAQQVFLDRFEQQVVSEATPFQAWRAESYGSSVWGIVQDAAMAGARASLFREGRREHQGSDKPCNGCEVLEAAGWMPIEKVPLIGSQECMHNCHCIIVVRDDADGPEYDLGRLPNVARNIHPSNFRSLGVRFRQSDRALKAKNKTLIVDVAKLDEVWAKDGGYYLPPNEAGASEIVGRRAGVAEYLKRAQREGMPFDQSQVVVDENGVVSFLDGRHRFAMLRDRGVKQVPVSVPAGDFEAMKERFGWGT